MATKLSPKEMIPDYIQPFSSEAEQRLLGALLLFREKIGEVSLELNQSDFYLTECGWIYEAICSLNIDGVPVNIETVSNYLKDRQASGSKSRLEEIGGSKYIIELTEGVETDEINYWIQVIKEKHHERRLLDFFFKGKQLLFEGKTSPSELQKKLEESLTNIVPETKSHSVSIASSVNDLDASLDKYLASPDSISGLPSGYKKLDSITDGFNLGNVSIFYAPSSKFKSLLATNIGHNLAHAGIPGLWLTTEMPRHQVLERILQLETGRNIGRLRKEGKFAENYDAIKSYKQALAMLPIYMCDLSAPEISQVRADVARFKRWHNIQYIIVDLVDHVWSSKFKDEMVNNQRQVMYSMKSIAKDFNIHVILISHIAKQRSEDRGQVDLDMESMIGSSAKYQDVDLAVSISPWEYKYNEKTTATDRVAMSRDNMAWHMATYADIPLLLSVTKNRHGPLGMVELSVQLSAGGRIREAIDKK